LPSLCSQNIQTAFQLMSGKPCLSHVLAMQHLRAIELHDAAHRKGT
jgi:hypothetical protein